MIDLRIGGVPEHFNYPWYLTLKDKKYHEVGINLRWKDFDGGTGAMIEALNNQQIDLAVVLTEGIVKSIAEGAPLKIIQVYVSSPLVWGVHVAANTPYARADQLKGHMAAISRYGSGSHLMSYVYGQNNNWNTQTDLKFEEVGDLQGGLNSLTHGSSDYFLWEKFTTKPFVDKGVLRCMDTCPTPWPCFVIAVHQDFLKNHPSEIEAITTIINAQTKSFKQLPLLVEQLAKRYGQNPEDLKLWLAQTQWSQDIMTAEEIDLVQEELLKLKLIKQKCPSVDFF
jgi:sulfonate transport system substrate-binding protein|tara:strand:+ start:27301 stop:28146 length:846 start_codon:yes stop_codon:yes gene_type:complete